LEENNSIAEKLIYMKYPMLVLRLLSALIMLQTLYFKFTAAPESVFIFSSLGMEPWGRIFVGFNELIASILLLIPATISLGALLGFGLMAGALFFHLSILGIEVQQDSGYLFGLCLIVLFSCGAILWYEKDKLWNLFLRIKPKTNKS
jgi:uncharacterized membrane protein YphA (DoxX/SURF4 family)